MTYAAARFAESGYHPTSVARSCRGSASGKGVFYWYFDSKEELFLEILKDAQTDLRRKQQQAIGDEADPVRRIELGHPCVAGVGRGAPRPQQADPVRRHRGHLRDRPRQRGQDIAVADVVKHVKEAIAQGRVRDTDPDVLAHAMVGVVGHLTRVFIYDRGDPPTPSPTPPSSSAWKA